MLSLTERSARLDREPADTQVPSPSTSPGAGGAAPRTSGDAADASGDARDGGTSGREAGSTTTPRTATGAAGADGSAGGRTGARDPNGPIAAGPQTTPARVPGPARPSPGRQPTEPTEGGQPTAPPSDDGQPTEPPSDDGQPTEPSDDDPTEPGGDDGTPPPEPDAQSLAFLRRGLWSVPEENTLCGAKRAGARAPGTLFGGWQDASDDGDFFFLCLVTADEPAWPVSLRIADPSGAVFGRATVRASGATERVFGQPVTPLVVQSADALRYNGFTYRTAGDGFDPVHISQVHFWLPHHRPSGGWSAGFAEATARVGVPAWCSTGAPTVGDPFAWPLGINFARNGFGEDVRRHCLARPDVEGRPVAEARRLVEDVLILRGASTDALRSVESCSAAPRGTVIALNPEFWRIGPASAFGDGDSVVVLIVSSGPC